MIMKKRFEYVAMMDAYPLEKLEEEINEQLANLLWSTDFFYEGEECIETHMNAIAQLLNATAIEKLEVLFTENKAHVGLVGFVLKNEDGTTTNLMEDAVEYLEIMKQQIIAVKLTEEQVQVYIVKEKGIESFYGDQQLTNSELEELEVYGQYEVNWYRVKKE